MNSKVVSPGVSSSLVVKQIGGGAISEPALDQAHSQGQQGLFHPTHLAMEKLRPWVGDLLCQLRS